MFLRHFGSKRQNAERKACAYGEKTDKMSSNAVFLSLLPFKNPYKWGLYVS